MTRRQELIVRQLRRVGPALVAVTIALTLSQPAYRAERDKLPSAPPRADASEQPAADSPTLVVVLPASGEFVPAEFPVKGYLKERLSPGQVLVALVRRGNHYWSRGIVSVELSGWFHHSIDLGGPAGTFGLVIATMPAELADAVDETSATEHGGLDRPWSRTQLGSEFRPLKTLWLVRAR